MPVLTPAECQALLSTLKQNKSFTAAAGEFRSAFAAEDLLRACCSVALLLEEEQLLPVEQRLYLWYILWDAHKDKALKSNPFVSFLIKAATTTSTPPVERVLLHQLLSAGHLKNSSHHTAQSYTSSAKVSQLASAKDAPALQRQYLGSQGSKNAAAHGSKGGSGGGSSSSSTQSLLGEGITLAALTRSHAATIRLAPASPTAAATGTATPPSTTTTSSSSTSTSTAGRPPWAPTLAAAISSAADPWLSQHLQQLAPAGLGPAWQRPRPPLLSPAPAEFKWVHSELPQALLWDNTMGEDPRRSQALRELVAKALQGPLLPVQQQAVLNELAADPGLVSQLGLAPAQLPALVENTPVLAYEVLLRLMPSPAMEDYLQVLAHMDMSLHSMEVVNRLTSCVDLPTEFLHLYITNCINSCEDIQDKYLQNRLVRLVCVFLHSLIRNKVIHIQDLVHEVQAFCINFSRIREAAALFRLLKQIEAGGVVPGGGRGLAGDAVSSPGSMEGGGGSSSCSPGPDDGSGGSSSLHVQLEFGRGPTPARA